ncbi:MAG TPA: hypothetical protein VIW25_07390 [Nitrososphaeraceae archaeon]
MVSVIEEKREREGRRLQQHHYQHHYNDYLQLESSAYSLFVLAIRSPQTKQKYLQRLDLAINFVRSNAIRNVANRYGSNHFVGFSLY